METPVIWGTIAPIMTSLYYQIDLDRKLLTHYCFIRPDNGLSLVRRQAIIWTNADILDN